MVMKFEYDEENPYSLKEWRKSLGLCVYCGELLDRDGVYCSSCNEKWNKWKHERLKRIHSENKCSTCGKPLDRKGWFCSECVKKLNNRAKERNAERRMLGFCVQCGEPSWPYVYCQKCRNARMDRYRRKKKRVGF
jgi:predicted amidophosphoribosyltransferase